jgi:hypothetical protein
MWFMNAQIMFSSFEMGKIPKSNQSGNSNRNYNSDKQIG